jgi:hypothetical protein
MSPPPQVKAQHAAASAPANAPNTPPVHEPTGSAPDAPSNRAVKSEESLLSHIPWKFFFVPQSREEAFVQQTIGAYYAARIPKANALDFLARRLPASLLLHANVINQPVIFGVLSELLNECGVDTRTTVSKSATGKVILTLLAVSAPDQLDEISQRVAEHDKLPQAHTIASAAAPTATNHTIADAEARARDMTQRRAAGISQRFQAESKYTGAPDSPDLDLVRLTYERAVRECMLVEEEPLQLVHHCFDGDAKRFYFSDVRIKEAKTHSSVFDLMRARFVPSSARAAITTRLRNLSFANMVSGNNAKYYGDPQGALDALYREIERNMPNVLASSAGDRNAGEFLRSAVLSETWASNACERYTTNIEMTFAELYAALTAAIVTRAETGHARAKAYAATSNAHYAAELLQNATEEETETHYGGSYAYGVRQGHAWRHRRGQNRPSGSRGYPSRPPHQSYRAPPQHRINRTCWRCKRPGHLSYQCTADQTMRDAVRARVRESGNDPAAAASTLYALADDLDEARMEYLDIGERRPDQEEMSTFLLGDILDSLAEEAVGQVPSVEPSKPPTESSAPENPFHSPA